MLSDTVKKLANSYKYQVLYNRAQDIGGIKLFKNEFDFTYIQTLFLHWLNIYNSLYLDLARKEEYLDEEIIKDPIRVEAYLIYRNKYKEKTKKKEDYLKNKGKEKVQAPGIPKIIFTSKGKK